MVPLCFLCFCGQLVFLLSPLIKPLAPILCPLFQQRLSPLHRELSLPGHKSTSVLLCSCYNRVTVPPSVQSQCLHLCLWSHLLWASQEPDTISFLFSVDCCLSFKWTLLLASLAQNSQWSSDYFFSDSVPVNQMLAYSNFNPASPFLFNLCFLPRWSHSCLPSLVTTFHRWLIHLFFSPDLEILGSNSCTYILNRTTNSTCLKTNVIFHPWCQVLCCWSPAPISLSVRHVLLDTSLFHPHIISESYWFSLRWLKFIYFSLSSLLP